MGLTARPTKNIDLSKIDDIQNEFFNDETTDDAKNKAGDRTAESLKKSFRKPSAAKSATAGKGGISRKKPQPAESIKSQPKEKPKDLKNASDEVKQPEPANQKIADLLATARVEGVRHTSRPFTVPRSLTIDLNRLKTKFRSRDLQYTQNELMDKMIREALETVTADNYFAERERAFRHVKSPEQCSRRSVTLTEETASEMAELKASLALKQNRRISSDEIFTTLLAVAFASLYENGLL
jgi:hypothetical protein